MNSILYKQIEILECKISSIKSIAVFGFKERVNIEKILFSILDNLTSEQVSGFNSNALNLLTENYKNNEIKFKIITKLFELRRFLKKISSGNAYVRDVALENANTNRIDVFKFIDHQINSMKKDIERL